ncbi:uncharacterized protein E0L32_003540 [Thyridium curvatum]|uniref:Uncharacterized protein n=1 Tax=Thyridium curvatum TaxID=1093900 RepID=A0A507BJV7_9PEZI|nr:uncharacterized protein E0L32_003540 [Thyridium curvatum]TPX16978.1 hypothetical protein E0L32_003540 [Thyridium curvatum]
MKFSLLLLPAAFSAVYGTQFMDRRADKHCAPGNNCQRGVGGTNGVKPPLTSRMADCSKLNTVTVSPYTITTISTTTVLERAQIPTARRAAPPPQKRQDAGATTIEPTEVPTYATYCKSASAYYSACSCAGVTAVTTTLPTPTSYTSTTTVSICPAKRAVKRAAGVFGYEMAEDFDHVQWDGIKLF